ncbi:MAG: cytochrome c peroxidase, partial [Pseudobdellovibrionaceae bacterium]
MSQKNTSSTKILVLLVSSFLIFAGCDRAFKGAKAAPKESSQIPDSLSKTNFRNESFVLNEIGGNGHALTWDGRVLIKAQGHSLYPGYIFHVAHAIRPQSFSAADDQFSGSAAFSAPYLWSAAEHLYKRLGSPANVDPIPVRSLNALALVKDQDFAENPYRSNATGAKQAGGSYETYRGIVFLQDYGICEPAGADCDPNAKVPYQFGHFKVQIVVRNPRTQSAEVESIRRLSDMAMMFSKISQTIVGFEPTLTADGRLMIFQTTAGVLVFTFNEGTLTNPSWTNPLPITSLYSKRNDIVSIPGGTSLTFGELYRIAQFPMRFADGTNVSQNSYGAYPWLDLDGDDLLFTAVAVHKADGSFDGTRAGQSIVGASTKGLWTHMDGGINSDRYRRYRLFISSFGRTAGKWTPNDLSPDLPITRKRQTYPIFASNASAYFEYSVEESTDGNYDVYLPMNEALKVGPGNTFDYDLTKTQDTSGNFHVGTRVGNPLFSDDFFNCTIDCDKNQEIRYSGKAMYFKPQDSIAVAHQSPTGHQLLSQESMTLSFALKILREPGAYNMIAQKAGTFHLILEANRQVHFTVYDSKGEKRSGFIGPQLPLNQWAHLTFTYNAKTGKMRYYIDGVLNVEKDLAVGSMAKTTSNLYVGPTIATGGDALYALDQLALSSFERPVADIQRQIVNSDRLASGLALPLGLAARDQFFVKGRTLDTSLVEVGRHLFFDKNLSGNGQVACATCHQPEKAWTDGRSTSLGINGQALQRNSQSILNMAFNSTFFHDGRAQTLSEQARSVILNPDEMNGNFTQVLSYISNSDQYKTLLQNKPVTEDLVSNAIAEFMLSLTSANSKHDRVMKGQETF